MKTIIVVYSYHHNNTEKVAHVIAEKINAAVEQPQKVDVAELQSYDLIGIGAGIDSGKHYAPILKFTETLPTVENKKVFIFSTSGVYSKSKMLRDHAALRNILTSKGYCVVDEFGCVGFNTNSVLKYIGGLNKGRPNTEDLKKAADFSGKLIQSMTC